MCHTRTVVVIPSQVQKDSNCGCNVVVPAPYVPIEASDVVVQENVLDNYGALPYLAMCERETPCGGVVVAKYDSSWGAWCCNEVYGLYGVRLWKILGGVVGSFLVMSDLRWEMTPKLDY